MEHFAAFERADDESFDEPSTGPRDQILFFAALLVSSLALLILYDRGEAERHLQQSGQHHLNAPESPETSMTTEQYMSLGVF